MSTSIADQMNMQGKTVWITGAAHGIGKAAAIALAKAGANIAISDIRGEMLEAVAEELRAIGAKAQAYMSDITNEQHTDQTVSQIVEDFGRIDGAFLNAGTFQDIPAEKMSLEEFRRVIDVNLVGAFISARAAGRVMIKQQYGRIVLTGSMSGHIVNIPQCQVAYNSSKAGVIHLGKSLAIEWAKHNIRVNTISPGYIYTFSDEPIPPDKVGKSLFEQWTPLKRWGQADELAGLVVYLLSDSSSFVTGADVLIDGGYTAF